MRTSAAKRIPLYLALCAVGLLVAFPFLWMLTTSLKSAVEMNRPPFLLPAHFHFENYAKAWAAAPFARYYLNTAIVTVAIVLGQELVSAMAAYALARLAIPFAGAILAAIVATMMVPFQVLLLPTYLIVDGLGWTDSLVGLIVPRMVGGFGIYLLYQAFREVPRDFDDAASIDGCSKAAILWRIVLPLSAPAVSALAIFSFLFAWNDFLWPLVATTRPEMRTVQLGLAMFQGRYGAQWNLLMAGTISAMAPTIAFYAAAQRRFIEGLAFSGLKG
jgi:ABC-type sugar transport system, permease component